MLEWYMARLVARNGHQRQMAYDEIKLYAQKKEQHFRLRTPYVIV